MPRTHYNKRNDSDSDDRYAIKKSYNKQSANIICCPRDKRPKYDDSSSDASCPDFSELCEDKPKICCEPKKLCKDKVRKDDKLEDLKDQSEFDESEADSDDDFKEVTCRGCGDKRCNGCSRCQQCGCRDCSDYSRTSVVSSLDTSKSRSECPSFADLADDKKRKCCDLKNPCKKHRKDSDKKDSDNKESDKKDSDKKDSDKKDSDKKESDKKDSYKKYSDKKDSDNKDSSASSSKGKKFIITFASKVGHPWAEYNKGSDSVHINGKNGPVLHLYRGSTYFFCVEQDVKEGEEAKHSFVLTTSPAGGPDSQVIPEGFAPVSKGCVCFKVGKNTPRYFFYQDSKHEFEGGLVIVHDV